MCTRFKTLGWILPLLFPAVVAGCGGETKPNPEATLAPAPVAEPVPPVEKTSELKNEIPPDKLAEVVRANTRGLGLMERYEYREATKAFREVHEAAPGWIPGSINLAIAMLNDSGAEAEAKKKLKGAATNVVADFEGPLKLLDDVIKRDPNNINAHYCRGLILQDQGKFKEAHLDYKFVTEADPTDGQAWLRFGSTLASSTDPDRPASIKDAKQLIQIYETALKQNPYMVGAIYRLQQAYSWDGKRDTQREMLKTFSRLDRKQTPSASGDSSENFYGEAGRYALIIDPFGVPKSGKNPEAPRPQFEPAKAIEVTLGEGETWVKASDFQGPLETIGRARARFGACALSFDVNGDGKLDLFLGAAVKGPKGVRDILLINLGGNRFLDASKDWKLPDDKPSLAAAAADFDADRRVDLFTSGLDGYHVWRNEAKQGFKDRATDLGLNEAKGLSVAARWIDLDQDGDLDLYVVNYTDLDHAPSAFKEDAPKINNAAFRNLGKPAAIPHVVEMNWAPIGVSTEETATEGLSIEFKPWPDSDPLIGPPANNTGVASIFIDGDRDLDLILAADHEPLRAVLNDRLGKFHQAPMSGLTTAELTNGLLVTDVNKDGRPDLVSTHPEDRVATHLNETVATKFDAPITWTDWPTDAKGWRNAQAVDLDLDTWADLVGLPAKSGIPTVDWSRNDGERFVTSSLDIGPAAAEIKALDGFLLADLVGDPLNDLIALSDGIPPQVCRNLGNGQYWMAIDLGGRWKTSFDHMRTNPHGLGTRIRIEGENLLVTHDHVTASSGPGESLTPIVLGLGKSASPELVRLKWPDGTMQCEMTEKANTKVAISEFNRKTGSCPVLFTWNGERFVCMGDFLGGGGLGYLVAPGIYGQPDRDESIGITADQLKPVNGVFRMSVTEPMDELAYLDKLELMVVDRPPGVTAIPDERFAPEGPRPTGEPIAWKSTIAPAKATDLKGNDVTQALAAWDRNTADAFNRLHGWIGYADEHGVVLDFADRLKAFGPSDRLTLVMAGWVEYPYSQTNYAASTAGVALKTPTVERRNPDGTWTVIEPHAGYPAGLPRMTTLDLTGKLLGDNCVIRIRTNMECYYDQAFIAVRDSKAEASLRTTTLPVARAVLGHRGYTREVSPDGKQPLLYDYDYIDPAPLAIMAGTLTRLGDVTPLLNRDDDQLCLVGPGDEARFEFDAQSLPALPEGWTRSFILKTIGYCKDADPLTATGDQIDPLPWRAMPEFPFVKSDTKRPVDAAYQRYLDEYQTRPAGGR